MTDLQAPQDAQVVMGTGPGAVTVNSSTNKVTGILPGVTLDLHEAKPDKVLSFSLSRHATAVRSKIESFLANYNGVVGYFQSQFAYDKTTGTGGPLFGDSTALSLQNSLAQTATDNRQVGGKFANLASIGITTDKTGKLSITDEELFGKAMSNPGDVQKLFADEQFGVATKMRKAVDLATNGLTGTVTMQDKRLSERFDELDKKIAVLNDRASRYEELLRLKFTAMESAMASLKSQSSALSAQLGTSSSSSSSSSSKS